MHNAKRILIKKTSNAIKSIQRNQIFKFYIFWKTLDFLLNFHKKKTLILLNCINAWQTARYLITRLRITFHENFLSKIITFVFKEIIKWYEHHLLFLLSLDTSDKLIKISKQNVIRCVDKLKLLYEIDKILKKLAHHKT